jgi:hypothetical protein
MTFHSRYYGRSPHSSRKKLSKSKQIRTNRPESNRRYQNNRNKVVVVATMTRKRKRPQHTKKCRKCRSRFVRHGVKYCELCANNDSEGGECCRDEWCEYGEVKNSKIKPQTDETETSGEITNLRPALRRCKICKFRFARNGVDICSRCDPTEPDQGT